MIALILALALFVAYNAYVIGHYRTIPVSLSETSYIASPTLFSGFIGTEALLYLAPWLDKSGLGLLPYAGTISLAVCASAPLFRESFHKRIHYVSGVVAFTAVLLWVALDRSPWWLATAIVPAGLTAWKRDNLVYWLECWACLLLGLLLF